MLANNDTWTLLLQTGKFHEQSAEWLLGAFLCCVVAGFAGYHAFGDVYPDLVAIVAACLMLSFALVATTKAFYPRAISVYPDRLELVSIWAKMNRTIPWDEIEYWREDERKGKDRLIYTICFKHRRRTFKLNSETYGADYPALQLLFRQHCAALEDNASKHFEFSRVGLVSMACVGMLMSAISYDVWSDGNNPVVTSDVVTIQGKIAHDGTVYKGSKGARYINIKLIGYPKWSFRFDANAYNATSIWDYTSNVRKGDSIQMILDKYEYHKKLVGNMPLSFWDKTLNYRGIKVFGLRDKKQWYLTLDNYNKERTDTIWSGFMTLLGGLIVLVAAMLMLQRLGYMGR